MTAEPSPLAQRIKERMEVLGLNAFSAARKAGLGNDFVRDILRGKVKHPSAARLAKLAEALECSTRYLLGLEDIEILIERDGGTEAPPPPLDASPESTNKQPILLPIRFELMADTLRKATDVVRAPLGFEAATIPSSYADKRTWFELVRDDHMDRIVRPGSLVQVIEMNDSERDQILDGDIVVITKRLVGPEGSFHYIERSLRRINYRYPDLGLWFMEFDSSNPEWPRLTDDIWREAEPTAPRRSLDEIAAEIEDEQEREAAFAFNRRLEDSIERARRRRVGEDIPLTESEKQAAERIRETLENPEWADQMKERLESHNKWKPKLQGKVIRVIAPVDPLARFGVRGE